MPDQDFSFEIFSNTDDPVQNQKDCYAYACQQLQPGYGVESLGIVSVTPVYSTLDEPAPEAQPDPAFDPSWYGEGEPVPPPPKAHPPVDAAQEVLTGWAVRFVVRGVPVVSD